MSTSFIPETSAQVVADISVTVDSSKTISVNSLSLGFMLDNEWEWKGFISNSVRRDLARSVGLKLARVFDYKDGSPRPCTYWDETTKTGIFNWADIDALVNSIMQIGAEPFFCLGGYGQNGPRIPSGMVTNPQTNLPYPDSFAAYASEWVKHFKAVGLPVRFYEIVNEPGPTSAGIPWISQNLPTTCNCSMQ